MYTRILVPLDGSKTAESVLPCARLLAGNLHIPVELLTVVDIAELSMHVHADQLTYFDTIIKGQVVDAEKYLSGIARSFQGKNVRCSAEEGVTAATILIKAEGDEDTLIAMATHGRSGLRRWLLGSIAEKVLRASNNPLLLVRANAEAATDGKAALDSVIVPLDGSGLAESILPYAVKLAKIAHLKLRLMRSYYTRYTTSMLFNYEDSLANLQELPAKAKTEAISYLEEKVYQLKNEGLSDVACFSAEGEPAEEIIDAAKGAPNSLIAMCTHGRSGVNRWMLGSVTEKVVRHSGNPVLVVRAANV
jgi:nucleotide-binding universal stress UspA family protein